MRLQELFETKEEDRGLISLSSAIYEKVKPYLGDIDYTSLYDVPEQELIRLGKIRDIAAGNSFTTLDETTIEIQGNGPFMIRAVEPGEEAEYEGKELLAFYEADTNTVVLNLKFINRHRMKTSITHELRHVLDEIKSGSYPGNAKRYFTPKKKAHQNTAAHYRAQPAEINARFTELLDVLSKRIIKWYGAMEGKDIKKQLTTDFKNLLVKLEIADLFPEKTRSPAYKRLVNRAYAFMQQEMDEIESRPDITKRATGSW